MPKLLQINVTSNWGSTGKIAEECNRTVRAFGWETYFAYGRYSTPSGSTVLIGPSPKWDVYGHYLENCVLDNEGLASRSVTRQLVERIRGLQPDIVHLHNIHDHWLNYQILFEYLNQTDIKVVWTFHDFWVITGHCSHFVHVDCQKWQTGCEKCPQKSSLIDRSKRNYFLKKQLFSDNRNLIIVPVSEWVGENVRKSFLKDKRIEVIENGIDTGVFRPIDFQKVLGDFRWFQKVTNGKFVIMAVSSQWKSCFKGLDDYKAMAKILKNDEVIVLVGVSEDIIKTLPSNIIGIKRTNNVCELAALYTRADVTCSFSSAETFGLTIVEGYACGTPAVVYDNTAPPALITPETGFVVKNHDWQDAYAKIQIIKSHGKSVYSEACICLAREKYDKKYCYAKYVKLYEEILLC